MKWLVFACLLILDVASKMGALAWVPPINPYAGGFPFGGIGIFEGGGIAFSLNCVVNTGAACGLFPGHPGLLFGLRLVIIAALIVYLFLYGRTGQKSPWPLWMIVTGAIGNVIDYAIYGHVIDFFHFTFWQKSFPVFNLADSYITMGVFFLLISNSLKKQPRAI